MSLLGATARPYPEQRLADTLRIMALCGVHPAIYQVELQAVHDWLKARPGLTAWLDRKQIDKAANRGKGLVGEAWQSARGLAEERDLSSKVQGIAVGLSERLRRKKKSRDE